MNCVIAKLSKFWDTVLLPPPVEILLMSRDHPLCQFLVPISAASLSSLEIRRLQRVTMHAPTPDALTARAARDMFVRG